MKRLLRLAFVVAMLVVVALPMSATSGKETGTKARKLGGRLQSAMGCFIDCGDGNYAEAEVRSAAECAAYCEAFCGVPCDVEAN